MWQPFAMSHVCIVARLYTWDVLPTSHPVFHPITGQPKQKVPLNSADRVFLELRDRSFAAVGPWLAERTKGLQHGYQDTRAGDRSLAELKDFASQLKSLPSLSRHIHLAESLTKVCGVDDVQDLWRCLWCG